ncbi:MAG: endonuclease NucS domain-containing protein, partial [Candidatus Woesearchaeota archaeon]
TNQDLIIQLPKDNTFTSGELRGTVSEITSMSINTLREVMNDQTNWVSLLGIFKYEKAISDYIANYPNRLEDGLLPYPDSKIREKVFKDRTRSDVLLIDNRDNPVVVECKQHAPSKNDIDQLRKYMRHLNEETMKKTRGILVHGGAQKIPNDIINEAKKTPVVEILSYSLDVDFRKSF